MKQTTKSVSKKEPVREYSYTVVYEKLPAGGYNVIVPAIPEICTFGDTAEEAREMAQDAILCHLQALRKDGEEIPEDPFVQQPPLTEQVKVSV